MTKQKKPIIKRRRYTLSFKENIESWLEEGARDIGVAPIDFIRIKINESMKGEKLNG